MKVENNIIKLIFTIPFLVFLVGSLNLKAQNFYIGLNTGYSFNSSTDNRILTNVNSVSESSLFESGSTFTTYENVNLSLGKGWSFGGVIGYSFNKFVGIELEVSYLKGSKTSSQLEYQGSYMVDDLQGGIDTIFYQGEGTKTMSSEMFRVLPTLILTPGFDKINPYMKMGAVFGFGTIYTDYNEVSTSSNNGNDSWSYTSVDNGGLAFGFTAAFGINYSINKKILLYGEGNFIAMSYAPIEGALIVNNGDPEEIEYSDNVTEESKDILNYPNSNYPNNFKKSHPFSSIGLKFGVKFNFQ